MKSAVKKMKTAIYFARDHASTSAWKVHDKNGQWEAHADAYEDYMAKHKGAVGKNIVFKSLKCKDAK